MHPMASLDTAPRMRPWPRVWLAYGTLLVVGAILYVLCKFYPAEMPFWMPWEFSWPVFLATALSLAWFFRGLAI